MIDIKIIPPDFSLVQQAFFYQCLQVSYRRIPAYAQVFLDKLNLSIWLILGYKTLM